MDVVRTANRLLLKDVAPKYDPPRPGDIRISYGDISEAKRLLGYEPQVGFQEGRAKSIEGYRHNLGGRRRVEKEEVIVEHLDLEKVAIARPHWPFLRDRRIDAYGGLVKRFADQTS